MTKTLRAVIMGENQFHVENKEKKQCRVCKIALRVESKWLLELPTIYTLGFQYPDMDYAIDRKDLQTLLDLIPNSIDLTEMFTVGGLVNGNSQKIKHVLRGLISYYGKHYMSFFYSEKHDSWFFFDDATIKRVGNFQDVKDKCLKGKMIPCTMFYEH